ncbi:MAG: hypothetical protein H6594_10375, partial [Flavobacteriales bacterium]|nr:hypothetical protein [Flavobacteriales bacterium]
MKCSDARPRKRHLWGALLVAALGPTAMLAQPTVDIGLYESSTPGTLELRVRPDGDFDQVVSSLTFTIRWETASGANLGTINQIIDGSLCPLLTAALSKSGDGEVDNGGYRYQTFNCFSNVQLTSCATGPGYMWPANQETVIMTIPVTNNTGCAHFNIVNDSYTNAENKDFYISLNGLDRTGTIYSPDVAQGNCVT